MAIHIYQDDLPSNVAFGNTVAIDTETMGLNPFRDRLCLVQLSSGNGDAHLVKIASPMKPCPNLISLIQDTTITKLFHFARFDISSLHHSICAVKGPIYCTKIASKLVRTYTEKHGLKDLCRELLQIEISKQQQSSDWGAKILSHEQAEYAAGDVLHLHQVQAKLNLMLERENRVEIAMQCFAFLPIRSQLDLGGFADMDVFCH
ncbi:ribonuclease D [Candidatus Puniceispirillum sp.]|nr:ribonuclease D [Candidatus Puniceispirillum sp.]